MIFNVDWLANTCVVSLSGWKNPINYMNKEESVTKNNAVCYTENTIRKRREA